MKEQYPDACYGVLQASNEVVIIKRYEMGYYKSSCRQGKDLAEARKIRDALNACEKVDKATALAMFNGSLFGWDVPLANPDYIRHEHPELLEDF